MYTPRKELQNTDNKVIMLPHKVNKIQKGNSPRDMLLLCIRKNWILLLNLQVRNE